MTRPFRKPPTTYEQQVEQLRSRGMVITDPDRAGFYLQHLNYYRLAAYWLPFEADHASHQFCPGTRFEDVLNLYIFDRELRLLTLDAIERCEVSMRSQWAYQMAHCHGPHAHLDSALARSRERWLRNYAQLKEEVVRSDETFIRHLRSSYAEELPPVWAVCEVISLGLLSRRYSNLNPMATRRSIARVYRADESVLQSWLHHLAQVRNVCAHHARPWNREFTVTPQLPLRKPPGLLAQFNPGSRKLYNTLVILLHCMDVVAPHHRWRWKFEELRSRHAVSVGAMGFPEGWEAFPIWREAGA